MSILKQMIAVCDFLKTEVCDKAEFLVPPSTEGEKIDESYIKNPVRGHPEIFPMTFDSNIDDGKYDKKGNPVGIVKKQAPAICVQISEAGDVLDSKERTISVRLVLQTWNPGSFTKGGVYTPSENDSALGGYQYSDETESSYIRNFDGWKESMSFMDMTIDAIEKAENIGGMIISRDEPIVFGPYTFSGEYVRVYPYWLNTISFKLKVCQTPYTKTDDMLNF